MGASVQSAEYFKWNGGSSRIHSTQVAKPMRDLHVTESKRFPQDTESRNYDRKLDIATAVILEGLKSNHYSNIIAFLLQIIADPPPGASSTFSESSEEIGPGARPDLAVRSRDSRDRPTLVASRKCFIFKLSSKP